MTPVLASTTYTSLRDRAIAMIQMQRASGPMSVDAGGNNVTGSAQNSPDVTFPIFQAHDLRGSFYFGYFTLGDQAAVVLYDFAIGDSGVRPGERWLLADTDPNSAVVAHEADPVTVSAFTVDQRTVPPTSPLARLERPVPTKGVAAASNLCAVAMSDPYKYRAIFNIPFAAVEGFTVCSTPAAIISVEVSLVRLFEGLVPGGVGADAAAFALESFVGTVAEMPCTPSFPIIGRIPASYLGLGAGEAVFTSGDYGAGAVSTGRVSLDC